MTPLAEATLDAIASGALAWSTAAQLAARVREDEAATREAIAELYALGLVDRFGEAWTLSTLSAERLNAELVDPRDLGLERWSHKQSNWVERRRPSGRRQNLDLIEDQPSQSDALGQLAAAVTLGMSGRQRKLFRRDLCITKLFRDGLTQQFLADVFDLPQSRISAIVRRVLALKSEAA